ncbi:rho GTPase-activating protein 32-like [Pitangus sulphuratus]|nr:rho GTPase-activating protein 32-like [Pitangus sulphuratus]
MDFRILEYPELEGTHRDHPSPAPGPAQTPQQSHQERCPGAPGALAGLALAAWQEGTRDKDGTEMGFQARGADIPEIPGELPLRSCGSTASMKVKNVKKLSFTKGHFPKMAECAHFHYENVDFGNIQPEATKRWFLLQSCLHCPGPGTVGLGFTPIKKGCPSRRRILLLFQDPESCPDPWDNLECNAI